MNSFKKVLNLFMGQGPYVKLEFRLERTLKLDGNNNQVCNTRVKEIVDGTLPNSTSFRFLLLILESQRLFLDVVDHYT